MNSSRFSIRIAMCPPGARPSERNRWAPWFDRASSSRYLPALPDPVIWYAILSGVVRAWCDGWVIRYLAADDSAGRAGLARTPLLDPGLVGDPVDLPGLAAVGRERLLEVRRLR